MRAPKDGRLAIVFVTHSCSVGFRRVRASSVEHVGTLRAYQHARIPHYSSLIR